MPPTPVYIYIYIIFDIVRFFLYVYVFFDIFRGLEAPQYPKNHGARHSSVFPKFQHRDFYGDPQSHDFYIPTGGSRALEGGGGALIQGFPGPGGGQQEGAKHISHAW